MTPDNGLPPFLVAGGELPLRELEIGGETRWWWTPRAGATLRRTLAASLGRRWPLHAARARARSFRAPRGAGWHPAVGTFLRACGAGAEALVASLGTPGHYRKYAASLVDGDGRVTAILKCSLAPASRGSLRADAAALGALAGHLPAELPRSLGCAELAGHVLTLQTPVSGGPLRAWGPLHDGFCQALARAGASTSWAAALAPRERVREELAAADGGAALASLCGRLLAAAEPELGSLPLVWAHRDFTAANVWRDRDRLAVIDWEWADPAWAPATDLLHFHLMPSLRRGVDPWPVASRLAEPGSALERYRSAIGLETPAGPLIALYLYDLLLFYAAADAKGLGHAASHPLVAAGAALGEQVLATGALASRRKPAWRPSSRVQTSAE